MNFDVVGGRQDGAGVLRAHEPAHVRVVVLRHRAEAHSEAAELPARGRRGVAAGAAARAALPPRRNVPSLASRAQQGVRCHHGD